MRIAQIVFLGFGLGFALPLKAQGLSVGSKLPSLSLEGNSGGKTDSTPWSTSELTGKAWSLFYVDPDEKDMNKEAQEAIKAKKFPIEKLRSAAIINMAATAIPNFILSNRIAKSQSEYPTTVYVKDLNKAIVKNWDLADNSSNLIILGSDGLVKYVYKGKLPADEISKMLSIIEKEVTENP